MRAVFGLVLVIGVALAGFAAYQVKLFMDAQEVQQMADRQAAAAAIPTITVIAAKEDIAYGDELTAEKLHTIAYAEPNQPEGLFLTMEDVFPEGEDGTRVALRQMVANEPLLASRVTEPGGDAGIASILSPGMSAFAIKVDVASGVSGLLRPGNFVDVYWTGQMATSQSQYGTREVTQRIISGIKIIAIDQSTDVNLSEGIVARTVTVEGTPQRIASLAQAQSTGDLMLSLNGLNDPSSSDPVLIDQNTLLGIVEEPEPVAATPEPTPVAEKVCTIRQRRGSDVVEVPIPCTN